MTMQIEVRKTKNTMLLPFSIMEDMCGSPEELLAAWFVTLGQLQTHLQEREKMLAKPCGRLAKRKRQDWVDYANTQLNDWLELKPCQLIN